MPKYEYDPPLRTDKHVGDNYLNDKYKSVGYFCKNKSHTYIVVLCKDCLNDKQLYGDGLFYSYLGNLKKDYLCCGCNKRFSYNEQQSKIIVERLCKKLEYTLIGWKEKFKGVHTKMSLSCPKHGIWSTTTISNFISKNTGCPSCGIDIVKNLTKKSDEDMILNFEKRGKISKGSSYSRSDKLTAKGHIGYWDVTCNNCGESNTVLDCNILAGRVPCSCSKRKFNFSYINLVYDNENCVACKFGITNNAERRLSELQAGCKFRLENFGVWSYKNGSNCKNAEVKVKNTMVCGVISKDDMIIGYTETTSLKDIDNIIHIFESYGGNRMQSINKQLNSVQEEK